MKTKNTTCLNFEKRKILKNVKLSKDFQDTPLNYKKDTTVSEVHSFLLQKQKIRDIKCFY